jgi:hypothetical protein
VGPRAGLDEMEKRIFLTLQVLESGPLGSSARTQSLYRLRFPGSWREIYKSSQFSRNAYAGNPRSYEYLRF